MDQVRTPRGKRCPSDHFTKGIIILFIVFLTLLFKFIQIGSTAPKDHKQGDLLVLHYHTVINNSLLLHYINSTLRETAQALNNG